MQKRLYFETSVKSFIFVCEYLKDSLDVSAGSLHGLGFYFLSRPIGWRTDGGSFLLSFL